MQKSKFNLKIKPDNIMSINRRISPSSYLTELLPLDFRVGRNIATNRILGGCVEWSFNTNFININQIKATNFKVNRLELEFYYENADLPNYLESIFISLPAVNPFDQVSDTDKYNEAIANSSDIVETILRGNRKNIANVLLSDDPSSLVCTTLSNAIKNKDKFYLSFKRIDASESGASTTVDIGGNGLLYGQGTEWRAATSSEPCGFIYLNIEYEQDEDTHTEHEMRYTLSDPAVSSSQNKPQLSIGGYASSNTVNQITHLSKAFGISDTDVYVSESVSVSSNNSLIRVGPEIIKFNNYSDTDLKFSSLSRGIVPDGIRYPSFVDIFPEQVEVLDVSKLFNNTYSDTEQYRCIAISQISNLQIQDLEVYLYENDNDDVVFDAGIEVPKFDAFSALVSENVANGSYVVKTTDSVLMTYADDFFKDAHVTCAGTVDFVIASHKIVDDHIEITSKTALSPITNSSSLLIHPAPSQILLNEITSPNIGYFFGFFKDGGSHKLNYGHLRLKNSIMDKNDCFYVWIKRKVSKNISKSNDTSALLYIKYKGTEEGFTVDFTFGGLSRLAFLGF